MQIVTNFVDGQRGRLGEEVRTGGEGRFFKKIADFVTAGKEIVIANVGSGFACGEFCQRM